MLITSCSSLEFCILCFNAFCHLNRELAHNFELTTINFNLNTPSEQQQPLPLQIFPNFSGVYLDYSYVYWVQNWPYLSRVLQKPILRVKFHSISCEIALAMLSVYLNKCWKHYGWVPQKTPQALLYHKKTTFDF